eukprot:3342386-Pyramimonas_sp.AAC.1
MAHAGTAVGSSWSKARRASWSWRPRSCVWVLGICRQRRVGLRVMAGKRIFRRAAGWSQESLARE